MDESASLLCRVLDVCSTVVEFIVQRRVTLTEIEALEVAVDVEVGSNVEYAETLYV